MGTHSVPNALSQEYLMHCFAGERPDNKAQSGSVKPVSTDSTLIVDASLPGRRCTLSVIIKGTVRKVWN